MAYVKQLKDADTGDAIFPVTHISAVTDGNGSNVGNLLNAKQDTLISGTNIKTINSTTLLGSGNIDVGVPFIRGTQTAATGSWTGVAPFSTLTDG